MLIRTLIPAKQKKTRQGFTIVELVVVIAVIGILAGITTVAYNGIQDRARITAGLAFEDQLKDRYAKNATGLWDFDECSGLNVANTGDPGNSDAMIGTAATWITDTPSGKGCALRFNGTTRIPTIAGLGAQWYVKAAWVRVAPGQACTNIISRGQDAATGADAPFWLTGCRLTAGYQGAYSAVQDTQTIMNDNKWHYVAVIWENGVLSLYNDGKMVKSTSGTPAPTPLGGFVSIAAHGTGNNFVGDIDSPFVAAQ